MIAERPLGPSQAAVEPPARSSELRYFPVTVNAIFCGDPDALSAVLTVAVSAPFLAGSKVTVMVQLPPDATLVPQVFARTKELAFVPVTEIPNPPPLRLSGTF